MVGPGDHDCAGAAVTVQEESSRGVCLQPREGRVHRERHRPPCRDVERRIAGLGGAGEVASGSKAQGPDRRLAERLAAGRYLRQPDQSPGLREGIGLGCPGTKTETAMLEQLAWAHLARRAALGSRTPKPREQRRRSRSTQPQPESDGTLARSGNEKGRWFDPVSVRCLGMSGQPWPVHVANVQASSTSGNSLASRRRPLIR